LVAAVVRLASFVVLATGCGVGARNDLVGRYVAVAEGRRETWTLRADGTCEIVRQVEGAPSETARCEWEWVEREGSATLVVTPRPASESPGAVRHRTRYVLKPTRLPGGIVTIPLGTGADLRKVE
jgi:hypothetical protein